MINFVAWPLCVRMPLLLVKVIENVEFHNPYLSHMI